MRSLRAGLAAALALMALPAAARTTGPSVSASGGELRIRRGAMPAGATEWEAFLSLDGGATFPLRVTPHLPASVREFRWRLPYVPTRAALVRMRYGRGGVDERDVLFEREIALAPPAGGALVAPRVEDVGRKPFPGEGQSILWVERSGARPRAVSPPPAPGLSPRTRIVSPTRLPCFDRTLPPAAPFPADVGVSADRAPALSRPIPASRRRLPPLLQTSRLNL